MPCGRFRRQYEQLSQFERGRIIGMMEAGWSARRVTRQLGLSDCVVRRCWDQWIREMSFTRRRCSGRPRQISRREDRHIVRNARVQPTASSAAIQAQVAPSIRGPCVFSNHTKDIWDRIPCAALDAHPSTSPFGVVPRARKLDCSGMEPGRLWRRIQIQSQQ
ncbi:uncharacterized protein TNCV_699351 [Trichonephila clavipes]|nr:uncharacterized protein TNCV_699351 [Trichonephila clavipes]